MLSICLFQIHIYCANRPLKPGSGSAPHGAKCAWSILWILAKYAASLWEAAYLVTSLPVSGILSFKATIYLESELVALALCGVPLP